MPPLEPRLETFAGYDALVHPGSGRGLIVSVAGVGNPANGEVPFEWRGTLGRVAGDAHVIYLRDRTFAWFNRVEGWDALVGFLRGYQERHAIERATAFGLSMGGYGAVALAGAVPFDRVVALGPQTCLGAAGAFDTRYQYLWERFPIRWPHLVDVPHSAGEYLCLFTIDQAEDVRHAAELRRAIPRARLVAFRGEHNLGSEMRFRGHADAFVAAVLAPVTEFATLGGFEPPPAVFGAADRHLAGEVLDEPVPDLPDAIAPSFLYPGIHRRRVAGGDGAGDDAGDDAGRTTVGYGYPAHLGTTALPHELAPYLAAGWGEYHPNGTWSLGRWHAIRAECLDQPPPERVRLLIHGAMLVGEGHPRQRVRFYQVGRRIAEHAVEGPPGERDATFVVEADGPLLDLVVETPDAVAPATLGMSVDGRALGLAVRRLSFGAVVDAAPADRVAPPAPGAMDSQAGAGIVRSMALTDPDILPRMGRFIARHLIHPVDLGDGAPFRALAETERRFADSRWFWADDNAKAAELLVSPALFDADPGSANAAMDAVLRLSRGAIISRRCGAPEIEVISEDPRAFHVRTTFITVTGDLAHGIVTESVRFNDGRGTAAVRHSGNFVRLRLAGGGLRGGSWHTLDVEDAVDEFGIWREGDAVRLVHASMLSVPGRLPGTARRPAGRVRYTYTVRADRPTIGLEVTYEAPAGVAVPELVLTTAYDGLTEMPAATYAAMTLGTAAGVRTHRAPAGPGQWKETEVQRGPVTVLGVVQASVTPGFAYAAHVLPARPADVGAVGAASRNGNFHWIVLRHPAGPVAAGGSVTISEERLLTAGGNYDDPTPYAALMREGEGGGAVDPSMTYDTGAELNAIAVHLLCTAAGRYANPPGAVRVAELRAWYDRHLATYLAVLRPGRAGDDVRAHTRGVAYVVLSLDCMLRATGEARYRAAMDELVALILRLQTPDGRGAGGEPIRDVWSRPPAFLDNHTSCVTALARAALHGDPGGRLGAAILAGLRAVRLTTWTEGGTLLDTVAVRPLHEGTETGEDTGFWNFKAGVTLRALAAVERAAERGAIALDAGERARIVLLRDVMLRALERSARVVGDTVEVLTSYRSGETNSETQPWVALGVDTRLDALIADVPVPAAP